jgi:benzoate-CoA ligase family protein
VDIAMPEPLNIARRLLDANLLAGRGNKLALSCEGHRMTYAEVNRAVNCTGNTLQALGVEMENRVVLILPDSPAFVASFLGAIKIGAVPVPLNPLLPLHEYPFYLNDSRTKVVIADASVAHPLAEMRAQLPFLKDLVVVDSRALAHDRGTMKWPADARETSALVPTHTSDLIPFADLLSGASDTLQAADTCTDDVAFWLYTSGSTGRPKAAVHLQHDILVCCEGFGRHVLEITEQDITFSAAKLFFAYGLGNSLYYPFWAGATTVLYPGRPTPEQVFEIIDREHPTIFYAVPTLYARLLSVEDVATRYDLSSVRLCISAGEPLPPELYHRWKACFGLEILDGIGTTELLQTFISNRPGRCKPGSSGTVVPGYDVRLVDELGEPVPSGTIGHLMVKGDSALAYYWNQHAKTQATIQGEWVYTGDRCSQDTEGYFWFQGRSDEMFKVNGQWVSPLEVETVLHQHPAVAEAAVVQGMDGDGLVKPKAFLVLNSGYPPSDALMTELQAFARHHMAPHKYPRWIHFRADLPRTATGKLQRYKLAQENR